MSIEAKDWYARINKMPGLSGPTLLVSGTVTVTNGAIEPVLVVSAVQDKSLGLRLDLITEQKGVGTTALTEKAVTFSQPSTHDVTHITIFHDGATLVRIDNVEIVH